MSKEKIVLIDGHSIMNRAFYGIPDLTNAEGLHTNAVYGFLNIMFRILDEEKPQYLAVAFDLHHPTFRHEMYKEYKGTRKAMPEELREQIPLIKEMLTRMGVPLMMKEGYEADDLIGTVSLAMEEKGLDVTILSGDRDLLQLASDTTLVRIPKTKRGGTEIENYHTQDVIDKYQVPPAGIIELKALMGDASDNIPGLPGVGEKTATKILVEYGNIENAHAHIDEIKPNKARQAMEEHWDLAVLSKELATINRHSPFEVTLEQARMDNLFTADALEMCKRLEFKNMLSKFDVKEEKKEEALVFTKITDFGEAEAFFASLNGKELVGLQTIYEDGKLLGIAVAIEETGAVYIPVEGFITEGYLQDKLQTAAAGITRISAIDLKEQFGLLEGIAEDKFFDCAIAAYLLNPLKNDYAYDDISKDYTSRMLPAYEELFEKKKKLADQPEQVMKLACYAAWTAFATTAPLENALAETEMDRLFCEIEMPMVFTLYDMQKEGIAVRADELKAYGEQLSVRITELERIIYSEAGEEFNINSPKQLGTILFDKMGMPFGKKTKTGYSTAADVLDKLAEDYPFVANILEYRQLTKLKSTYAEGLYAYIGEDGRIHGKFNQTVTATGRISSADPNLQNIPVRTQLGRELRKVFVPKDGCVFVDADYSQIELRVLAAASGDEKLIEAYREAKDIHATTASQVFHIPLEEVTPTDRRNAKAVNFGIVYGQSAFGLSNGLSITQKEAKQYIEQYFKTYPGIKAFLDGSVESAKETGCAVTMFGRRRPVPELKSSNFMQRSFGERVAMNAPIQGTAADIMKIAMVGVRNRLKEEGLKSRIVVQVHDELLIETAKDELEQVKKILSEEMIGAADMSVALEIDMNVGDNWYEAH